jgi:hypothetical protein
MSEMVLGSDEQPTTLADRIHAALVGFTACIGTSLEGICSYSLTFGDTYIPFMPNEDDDCDTDEDCNQAWVRVTGVTVAYDDDKGWDKTPGGDGGPCDGTCGGTFSIGLEVGVLRCYEVPEGGEAPTADLVLASAMQSVEDMSAIYLAAMNCEEWESIDTQGWNPEGPLGGQYGGWWNFTVEL